MRKIHLTWPSKLNNPCQNNNYFLLSLLRIAPALFGVKPLCESELANSTDYTIMLSWIKNCWPEELTYFIHDYNEDNNLVLAAEQVEFEDGDIFLFNKILFKETLLQVQHPGLKQKLTQLGFYSALEQNQWQQILEKYRGLEPGDELPGIFYGYPESAVVDYFNHKTPDPETAFFAKGRRIVDFAVIRAYFDAHDLEDTAGLLEKGYSAEEISLVKEFMRKEKEEREGARQAFLCRWQNIAISYKGSAAPARQLQQTIDRFDAALELMAYYLNFVQGLQFHLKSLTDEDAPHVFSMGQLELMAQIPN